MSTIKQRAREISSFARMFPDASFVGLTFAMAWVIMVITLILTTNAIDPLSADVFLMVPGGSAIIIGWLVWQRHVIESEFADEIIDSLILGDLDPNSDNPYHGIRNTIEHENDSNDH